jgi:hypothetical protein
MPVSGRRFRPRTVDERGTGLVSTLFGATAFLLFLLFATQVLVGLYTTTVVSSAALDAAGSLARTADPSDTATQQRAETAARARLGRFGSDADRVQFDWTGTSADTVVVTVHARKMSLLPAQFGGQLGNRIDRTYRVRVEAIR